MGSLIAFLVLIAALVYGWPWWALFLVAFTVVTAMIGESSGG